jgi:hypothetical protein
MPRRVSFFDPLIAEGIALWMIGSTLREVVASQEELPWRSVEVCFQDQSRLATKAAFCACGIKEKPPWPVRQGPTRRRAVGTVGCGFAIESPS